MAKRPAPSSLLTLKTALTLSPEKRVPVDPETAGAVTIQGEEPSVMFSSNAVAVLYTTRQMLTMLKIPIIAMAVFMIGIGILMIGRRRLDLRVLTVWTTMNEGVSSGITIVVLGTSSLLVVLPPLLLV